MTTLRCDGSSCARGHALLEAENGEQGLKLLEDGRPDLIITDILMPEKEGIDTIREALDRAPGTKIIAISGGGAHPRLRRAGFAREAVPGG